MLDVREATPVGNLAYGEVFVLEKFTSVVDTHLDNCLFRGDAVDGFVKVTEAFGTKKRESGGVRNRYARVVEISMQIFDTEVYRLVCGIVCTVAMHILYQFQNGEENRVGVWYVSVGLAIPAKGDITKERNKYMGVQSEGKRRELSLDIEVDANGLFPYRLMSIRGSFGDIK